MDNFDLRKYLAENKLTQEEFNNENLEEAPKSNKIKKSELKEMIRQSFLEEDSTIDLDVTNDNSDYDPLAESENLNEGIFDTVEINEAKKDEMEDESRAERADVDRFEFEKGKEEGEDEVKGGTGNKFLDQLETLKQEAERLNDAKLIRQIDNTITYYTRQHIAKPEMEESLEEMDKDYYDAAERDDASHIAALEKDMEDDKRSSRD